MNTPTDDDGTRPEGDPPGPPAFMPLPSSVSWDSNRAFELLDDLAEANAIAVDMLDLTGGLVMRMREILETERRERAWRLRRIGRVK